MVASGAAPDAAEGAGHLLHHPVWLSSYLPGPSLSVSALPICPCHRQGPALLQGLFLGCLCTLYHLLGPSFARRVLHSHAGAACTPSCSPVSLSSRAEWPAASWATPPGGPQALRSQSLLSSSATGTPSRSKALSCIYPHVILKNPSMPLSPQAPPCPRASTPSSASLQPAVTGLG